MALASYSPKLKINISRTVKKQPGSSWGLPTELRGEVWRGEREKEGKKGKKKERKEGEKERKGRKRRKKWGDMRKKDILLFTVINSKLQNH